MESTYLRKGLVISQLWRMQLCKEFRIPLTVTAEEAVVEVVASIAAVAEDSAVVLSVDVPSAAVDFKAEAEDIHQITILLEAEVSPNILIRPLLVIVAANKVISQGIVPRVRT